MSFGQLSKARADDPDGARADAVGLLQDGRPTAKGKGYQFAPDCIHAVDVALELGRPLLVAGEPGSGKTELGYAVARALGVARVHFYVVKSTSEAGDLFYRYDALRRFRDVQLLQSQPSPPPPAEPAPAPAPKIQDIGDYVEFQALGTAILDAHKVSDVADLLRGKHAGGRGDVSARRSVVIIDEIDKAPRDFPNDLLHEIENLSFRVREFPGEPETPPCDRIPAALRPIIVITSNEERQLPDAFLRRCVFHEIEFPDAAMLERIVQTGLRNRLARMGWHGEPEPALDESHTKRLVALLTEFRRSEPDKRPGIAEMLDAAALLFVSGRDLSVARPALAKLKRDAKLLDLLLQQT